MAAIITGEMLKEPTWTKDFADKIADTCYKKYACLPKKGKPNGEREWTLLACIVKVEGFKQNSNISMEVVSLGTGSKCIGKSKMSPSGDILNDSHAEVMARRGFLLYLYRQIYKTYRLGNSEVFHHFADGKCVLNDNITFHFFSSHTPCGDASIIPKIVINEDDVGLSVKNVDMAVTVSENKTKSDLDNSKISHENNNCHGVISISAEDSENKDFVIGLQVIDVSIAVTDSSRTIDDREKKQNDPSFKTNFEKIHSTKNKKRKLSSNVNPEEIEARKKRHDNEILNISSDNDCLEKTNVKIVCTDIYRTGAKCLSTESVQDEHLPGSKYHVVGVLRTKPGRGDATLSLSCSDKLARWNAVGLQGALLSLLIDKPIYFQSLIIGGECPFSKTALQRAIIQRVSDKISPAKCNISKDGYLQLPEHYSITTPFIEQSTLSFIHRRDSDDKKPCPSSMVWCNVPGR